MCMSLKLIAQTTQVLPFLQGGLPPLPPPVEANTKEALLSTGGRVGAYHDLDPRPMRSFHLYTTICTAMIITING